MRTIQVMYIGDVDALLANINGMATLEEISFYHAPVSASGTRHLASFPHLKRLLLYDRVDPTALEVLKNHVGIEKLYFTGRISQEQVAALKTLPNLRDLTLHVELDDPGTLDLHGLPDLVRLDLGSAAATDAALAGLEEMKNLTDLILDDSRVTDTGLFHLRTNRNLKRLSISGQPNTGAGQYEFARIGRPISDAGLAQLTGLTELEELNLSKTRVSDDGLEHIKGLTRLQKLNLNGTRVTHEGVKRLQHALPNCEITWKPLTMDERQVPAAQD